MSDSSRPHRLQPTRLPRPWDSPGKNTGVGCHFLLQCMKVKGGSEVTQSCPTLSNPMDWSLPGSSIHGIFQARLLEWGAIAFSQWTWVWVNSRSSWWTGRPGVLRFMGSQKVGHDWATELNWTELILLNHGFLQIYTQEWGCWIPLGFTIKDSFVLGNESLVGSSF